MKTAILATVVVVALSSGSALAGITYDASYAKQYAWEQAQASGFEGDDSWTRWYKDCSEPWGNGTNLANQAIIAGLAKTTSPRIVYYANQAYNSDPRWYYSKKLQSDAWRGPHDFYQYVKANNGGKVGMNFSAQTHDGKHNNLNFAKVAVGDIVFVDWENDNKIDHTMMVTGGSTEDYASTLVSYQSGTQTSPKRDKSLSALSLQFGTSSTYHVFRPTQYNSYGRL